MQPEGLENGAPQPLGDYLATPATPEATSSEREPFWGYLDLALVVGLLIGAMVLVALIAGIILYANPKLRGNPAPLMMPMNLVVYGALYLSLRAALQLRYHQPVFRSLGWRRTQTNPLILIFGGIVLAFVISLGASLMHTPKIATPFDQFTKSPVELAIFAIMAVVIAPIFEELFFRGFVQPLLSRTFGVIAGVLITAALFGALHLMEYAWAWQYALFITLAGAVFGWLRARTGSIIPSTLMHGAFNAVSVIALAFGKNI
jgi:membrane protease YdiL (CAAX protease family)